MWEKNGGTILHGDNFPVSQSSEVVYQIGFDGDH